MSQTHLSQDEELMWERNSWRLEVIYIDGTSHEMCVSADVSISKKRVKEILKETSPHIQSIQAIRKSKKSFDTFMSVA